MHKYKKRVKKARLLYGEGLEDKALFTHIRDVVQKNQEIVITVASGTGGTAYDVIDDATRTAAIGNFQSILVVIDRDDKTASECQKIIEYANKNGLSCLFLTPSLEGLILSIIESKKKWKKSTSKICKHVVESKYIDSKRRADKYSYKKITGLKILNAAIVDKELSEIIDFINGL